MADVESYDARAGALAGVPVADIKLVAERHGFRHLRATLADGQGVFIKAARGGESGDAFAAEANGLRWLAEARALPVPEVLGVDESMLVIELLPEGAPSPTAAREFGVALARMHAAGAPAFGAPWPGYIASLPLDNTPPRHPARTDWGSWYAERRLVPYLRRAYDDRALTGDDVR